MQETDPTKLGKAMIDTLTRNTIVGILTMLIVLPMLSPVQQDYSGVFALRQVFWFGRSSCTDAGGFFCDQQAWVQSEEGWNQILQSSVYSARGSTAKDSKTLLWLYVPDWTKGGAMNTISAVTSNNEIVWN